MDILEIIKKKRDGKKLSRKEIQFFVDGVCSGAIKDFQITSLLMAICLNDIDFDEIYHLTICMAQSGEMIDLRDIGVCVDKHSTGGVSDTTTLVVVPTLASLGLKVAKMSGRSLGHTGGTADKMEVFKGYKTEISTEQFKELIKKNGASIVSPSDNIALADKIIYKLRSESGTVENIGLIASSIMSKKLACGAKIVLLDCKYGNGAFMKTLDDCKKLASVMVKIGNRAGVKVMAVISSMDEPLTKYVGNNLEVYSAIKVLCGENNNLFKLSAYLSARALVLFGYEKNFNHALAIAEDAILSGKSKEKLKEIISSQNGDITVIENPELLLPNNNALEIFAKEEGYISNIDTFMLGVLSHKLQVFNGEFNRQDDVGMILNVSLGDYVKSGHKLLTCFYNKVDNVDELISELEQLFKIGDKPAPKKLVECLVEQEDER